MTRVIVVSAERVIEGVLIVNDDKVDEALAELQAADARGVSGDAEPFVMMARFNGVCYDDDCDRAIRKATPMVRDPKNRKNYCIPCGHKHFPVLARAEEANTK